MLERKDRLKENPEFVERANEDFYFATRDRELIRDMKDELRKVESQAHEGRILKCPDCPGILVTCKVRESILHRCNKCEGIWLGRGELDSIIRSATRGPLGAFFDRCFSK